jgi:signal transduction histidine kinase
MSDSLGLGRLADEQAALRRVATLVAARARPAEVFEAVITEVGRQVSADAAALARYERDGTITTIGLWSEADGYAAARTRKELGTGSLSRLVLETGRPGRVNSYEAGTGGQVELARELGWRSAVAAPAIVDGRVWGAVAVASKTDEPLPEDTEGRLAEFTELLATAIANAHSREELEGLAEEQAALRRVATLVAEGAPPFSVFAVVAEEVARIVQVPLVSIVRDEHDGTGTEFASFSHEGARFEVGSRWSLEGTNVVARVLESGQPARINDYEGLPGTIAEICRRSGIRSTVGIPIVVAGRVWGAMVVSSEEVEPLPDGTETRLTDFTELVATAIANAQSRAELDASRARIVATADETRQRIERDLHDGAQQQLVSLALRLRAVQAEIPDEHDEHRVALARAVEGLSEVLEELREIARGIHPAILDEGGLGPALKTLARRSAVPLELDLRTQLRLPVRVEVAAYHVVSEALTNATKYAQASVVHVSLETVDHALHVSVRDDGPGGADPKLGSGLTGLKDRVEAIGGTMSLDSPPGAGTTLQVELPLG